MARWQFTQGKAPYLPLDVPEFDDGHPELPGEDGFSAAEVVAQAGPDRRFNYVGPSED